MKDIRILGNSSPEFDEILSDEATDFVASLAREFSPRVAQLLAMRIERQSAIDAGQMPDFLASTAVFYRHPGTRRQGALEADNNRQQSFHRLQCHDLARLDLRRCSDWSRLGSNERNT